MTNKQNHLLVKRILKTFNNSDCMVFIAKQELFVMTHFFDQDIDYKIKNILIKMNISDIKFDKSYTFSDLTTLVRFSAFDISKNMTHITPKCQITNGSSEFYLRKLFIALLGDTLVLYANSKIFTKYKNAAWDVFVKSMFLYVHNFPQTQSQFVNTLLLDPYSDLKYDDFLGFSEQDKKFLCNKVKAVFMRLTRSGVLVKKGNTYICTEESLQNFCRDLLSKPVTADTQVFLPKYKERGIYNFCSNINPLGPSIQLINNFKLLSNYIDMYPDPTNLQVNQILAKFFGTPVDNITITRGSIESMSMIPRILECQCAGTIDPTFYGFESVFKAQTGKEVKKLVFKIDNLMEYSEQQIAELAKVCDLIYICNINNPTSSYIESGKLLKLIKQFPKCHFLIEESNFLYHDNRNELSLISHIDNLEGIPNLSIVYCFSKIFCVAGLRLGCVISTKKMIAQIRQLQDPFELGILGQICLPIILEDTDFLSKTKQYNKMLIDEFMEMLANVPNIKVFPSRANFVMCELLNGRKAKSLVDALEKRGFMVRDLTYAYKNIGEMVRISINDRILNKKLIQEMTKLLS